MSALSSRPENQAKKEKLEKQTLLPWVMENGFNASRKETTYNCDKLPDDLTKPQQ